jgi:hypothetical protein
MWYNLIQIPVIKSVLGITSNTYDQLFLDVKDALIKKIETITGLDFRFTNSTVTDTVTHEFSSLRDRFNRPTIFGIGAWQSITGVEYNIPTVNDNWYPIERTGYIYKKSMTQAEDRTYPVVEVRAIYGGVFPDPYTQLRITGVKGFGTEHLIPKDLYNIFLVAIQQANTWAEQKGRPVSSESDLTSSVDYAVDKASADKVLDTVLNRPEVKETLSHYTVQQTYPY